MNRWIRIVLEAGIWGLVIILALDVLSALFRKDTFNREEYNRHAKV